MPCCGSLAWSSARLVAAQGNRVFTFAANPPPLPAGAKAWEVNKYDATSDSWTSCAHAPHRPVCSRGVGEARYALVCRQEHADLARARLGRCLGHCHALGGRSRAAVDAALQWSARVRAQIRRDDRRLGDGYACCSACSLSDCPPPRLGLHCMGLGKMFLRGCHAR
jgi:hypothetical protein